MKTKLIIITFITMCLFFACKKLRLEEKSNLMVQIPNTKETRIKNNTLTFLDSFKQNKDEQAFLINLYKKFGSAPRNEYGSYKLIRIEDIMKNLLP